MEVGVVTSTCSGKKFTDTFNSIFYDLKGFNFRVNLNSVVVSLV